MLRSTSPVWLLTVELAFVGTGCRTTGPSAPAVAHPRQDAIKDQAAESRERSTRAPRSSLAATRARASQHSPTRAERTWCTIEASAVRNAVPVLDRVTTRASLVSYSSDGFVAEYIAVHSRVEYLNDA